MKIEEKLENETEYIQFKIFIRTSSRNSANKSDLIPVNFLGGILITNGTFPRWIRGFPDLKQVGKTEQIPD